MSFTPNQDLLQRVCLLVQRASSGQQGSREALNELENMYGQQLTFTYLAFVFSQMNGDDNLRLRVFAGWALKRCLRPGGPCDPRNDTLQKFVLGSLADPSVEIGKCASSIITTIVDSGGLVCWGINLLQVLCESLERPSHHQHVDGILRTLVKLCEDHIGMLNENVNKILPVLLGFIPGENKAFTLRALHGTVAVMQAAAIADGSPTQNCVGQRADEILNKNVQLAQSEAPRAGVSKSPEEYDLLKCVCKVFVLLLRYNTSQLNSMLPQICGLMLQCAQDQNEELAIEGCEMWSSMVDRQVGGNVLYRMLESLIPTLLNTMVYSEDEIGMIMDEPDDCSFPDKTDQPHRRRDNEDDEDSGDEAEVGQWTLRKCSAIALDDLAAMYGDEILIPVLQQVEKRMDSQAPWKIQEGAILTLGAIAEGCIGGMRNHLPALIPRLVSIADNTEAHILVRTISLWTLSRYAQFVVEAGEQKFTQVLRCLVGHMQSNSKAVQEAAVSALVEFIGAASPSDLRPTLGQLCPQMNAAYRKFQVKNTRILFDAIIALCRKMGPDLVPFTSLFVNPLQQRWGIPDSNTLVFSIFSVMTAVFQSMGSELGALSMDVIKRCHKVLGANLTLRKQCVRDQDEPPEPEFIMTSLDLIAAVVTACPSSVNRIFEELGGDLVAMIAECAKDPVCPEIRQSALGCSGDLFRVFPGPMQGSIPNFVQLCMMNLSPEFPGACTNAVWCLGEIALNQQPQEGGPDLINFVDEFAGQLTAILSLQKCPKGAQDQCALTLGKLSSMCPQKIAPHYGVFFKAFCVRIRGIPTDAEKGVAMTGMLQAVKLNPDAALESLSFLVDAIVSFGREGDDATFAAFREILQGFKEHFNERWQRAVASIRETNPAVVSFLSGLYDV